MSKHYHVYMPNWRVKRPGSPEEAYDIVARLGSAPLGFEIVREGISYGTRKPPGVIWSTKGSPPPEPSGIPPVRAWRTRSAAGRWARRHHGLAITHQCDSPDCGPETT